jgi:hypothetical protein
MSNKILILPNFAEQELPSEGLDRYDCIFLLTEDQDNLPFKVVKNLMNIAKTQQVDIDFLEIPHKTENELFLNLAFTIARMVAADANTQVTFVTENRNYDNLVDAAKGNGFAVARAEGFSRISAIPSGPSQIQNPLKPTEVANSKPAAKVEEVRHEPQPAPAKEESKSSGDKNKKLIASLLNGKS